MNDIINKTLIHSLSAKIKPKTRLWLIKRAHSKEGGKQRKYFYSDVRLQLGNDTQYLTCHKHAENRSIHQAVDCCVVNICAVLLPAWHNWELRISWYCTVRRAQRIRDSTEEHYHTEMNLKASHLPASDLQVSIPAVFCSSTENKHMPVRTCFYGIHCMFFCMLAFPIGTELTSCDDHWSHLKLQESKWKDEVWKM